MNQASGTSHETKYPIILVHGMGVRDFFISAWGRVPKLLQKRGCKVFCGTQDANGSVEDNAAVLKARVLGVIAECGCDMVYIIAHSKGGLDARYMITHLDMASKVASLTTVATPHHGSKTVDFAHRFPKFLLTFGSKITDLIFKIAGDKHPKTYECICTLTTKWASSFNQATPNAPDVYYQSYAFYMKHWYSDIFMWLPYLAVYLFDGKSDGLVAPSSAQWGNFRGAFCGNSRRGISHCDEVDMRRFRFTKKNGDGVSDMAVFYGNVVAELADMGF